MNSYQNLDIFEATKLINSMFRKLNGEPIERDPHAYPYSYDCHIIWQKQGTEFGEDFTKIAGLEFVYSDRMIQWDYAKFNESSKYIWGNEGQMFFTGTRESFDIERFLQTYFDNPNLKLFVIAQGANVSNGYPYWVFGFKTNK